MKIRTDFVTNSSSSFVVELKLVGIQGNQADMDVWAGSEMDNEDNSMRADYIDLVPEEKNGKVYFGDAPMDSSHTIADLCNMLFETATVYQYEPDIPEDTCEGLRFAVAGSFDAYRIDGMDVLPDIIEDKGGEIVDSLEDDPDYLVGDDPETIAQAQALGIPVLDENAFARQFDPETYIELNDTDNREDVSVKSVAQKAIAEFLERCEENGLTIDNLSRTIVRNTRTGNGDSAIFIPHGEEVLSFRRQYVTATEGER